MACAGRGPPAHHAVQRGRVRCAVVRSRRGCSDDVGLRCCPVHGDEPVGQLRSWRQRVVTGVEEADPGAEGGGGARSASSRRSALISSSFFPSRQAFADSPRSPKVRRADGDLLAARGGQGDGAARPPHEVPRVRGDDEGGSWRAAGALPWVMLHLLADRGAPARAASAGAQGVDRAAEVGAGGRLGRLRVPGADRLDHRQVLTQRTAAAGPGAAPTGSDGAQLGVEPLQETDGRAAGRRRPGSGRADRG